MFIKAVSYFGGGFFYEYFFSREDLPELVPSLYQLFFFSPYFSFKYFRLVVFYPFLRYN